MQDSQDYSIPFEDRYQTFTRTPEERESDATVRESPGSSEVIVPPDNMIKILSSCETSSGASLNGRSQTINVIRYYERLKVKSCWEVMVLVYLMAGLVVFTVGLCITANTFWAVCGPVSMFILLFLSSLHRDYQEGSLDCSHIVEFFRR